MELDAIAPNVREDLSGNQDGDERVLEGDPSTQKCETDDHRDESDADTAQELSDERRLERDANRTNCDGVFGVDIAEISLAPYSTAPRARSSVVWCNSSSWRLSRTARRCCSQARSPHFVGRLVDR